MPKRLIGMWIHGFMKDLFDSFSWAPGLEARTLSLSFHCFVYRRSNSLFMWKGKSPIFSLPVLTLIWVRVWESPVVFLCPVGQRSINETQWTRAFSSCPDHLLREGESINPVVSDFFNRLGLRMRIEEAEKPPQWTILRLDFHSFGSSFASRTPLNPARERNSLLMKEMSFARSLWKYKKRRKPSLFLWSSYFRPSSYGRATSVPLPMVELLPSLFLWSSYFRPSISSISLSYPNRIIALKEAHIALSLHSVKNNDFCHRKNKKSSHIHRSNCLWANSLLESSLWFGPTPKRELMSSLA